MAPLGWWFRQTLSRQMAPWGPNVGNCSKRKQKQDDKGKVKGTTCCLWLKQLQTKSQALEDNEEDKTAKANPIRGNGLKSSGR